MFLNLAVSDPDQETSLKMVYGALASKARGESCIRGYWLVDDSILVTLLSANLMESFEPMDDHLFLVLEAFKCWVRATCSLYHRQVGVTFLACEINEYGGWSTGERDTPLSSIKLNEVYSTSPGLPSAPWEPELTCQSP
ncbi:hypothetical protein EJB05_14352 [Eragrostis curvula]|uniref:Uncharacterized protein n=1 Tax=Eragrostis curvula TaxID=38414 RepID=A0A5J9VZ10_9POAL|nr:hypothetical protein EJB05_14352 [Eragrostis curvula]